MHVAQLPPDEAPVATPPETDGNAVAQVEDPAASDTQVGAIPDGGNFSDLTIAELLQLDLVLPEGTDGGEAVAPSDTGESETVDLTELSLLELMNLRATAAPQPDLPELIPADVKLLLNDTSLNEGEPSHLSPGELTPIGVLAGTNSEPELPPPPPPPPPPDINVPPDAINVTRTGNEDTAISITLRGTDPDGAVSSVRLSSLPTDGTLYANAGMTVLATVGTNYAAAGAAHTFYFMPAADFNGTVTFQYTVVDNSGFPDPTAATATITVNAVNDPPDAVADSYTVSEDGLLTVGVAGVLSNDTDTEGDALLVSAVNNKAASVGTQITLASGALLTMQSDGSYVYDPNGKFDYLADGKSTTDSFTYTVSDGNGGTDKATVTITVTGVNDAPVANADANGSDVVIEDKDASASGNVLINDVDPDSTLTVTTPGIYAGVYGSLTIDAAGNYTYALNNADPDTNALDTGDTVTETFSYTASDGTASASANLVITISGRNDAPVANNDANGGDPVVEDSDATASGNVLANDVDPDDPLSVTTAGTFAGIYGSLTIDAAGNYTYTLNNADPDTNALDSGDTVTETFGYTTSDGTVSASANLVITISGANDAPVANADANGSDPVVEDSDSKAIGNVLTNDVDPDDSLTVTTAGTFAGTYGSLTIDAAGNYTYTLNNADPDTNALDDGDTVTETFSYTTSDGTATANANLVITISGKNDAPVANADANGGDAVVEDSDATASGNVLTNDVDPDDALTVTTVGTFAGTYGSLTIDAAGNYTYTLNDADPDTNALDDGDTVTETFSYTTSDGTASASANLVITISGANDAPVANADANGSDPVVEDSDAAASGNVLTNDVDPDDSLTVTTAGTFAGTYGSLTIDAAGNYTYTLNNADPDTNALDDGDTVTETFSYTTSDGTATANANLVITISGKNDAPVANADANGGDAVVEDSDATAIGNVLTNDVDPDDALTVTTVGIFAGTYGSLTIDAAGNYTYTLNDADPDTNALNEGQTVTETFGYTASDGTASDSANLVITITGKNDAPNAVDDALSTDEDGALTYVAPGVLANDTDVDNGDTRTVAAVNGNAADVGAQVVLASGALLTLNVNGSLSYDPNGQFESLAGGQTTTDSFTYTTTDSHGATDTATATITITGKNDAPTDIALDNTTVPEDATVIGKLAATDPDFGDTHVFTVSDARFEVVGGDQLQLKAGNILDFETEPSISIDVTATDKGGLDHTKTFTITVTDVASEALTGDSSDNLLVADAGNDTLTGLAGNDSLIGGAGADVLSGGADDDALVWDAADTTVDGGAGTDTLLVGTGDDLDLGAAGALTAIERVDLGTSNGNNTLTLTAADVITVSDSDTITVVGGGGDKLEAGSGWSDGGVAGGLHTYTQSGATLVVDVAVTVNADILT